MCLSLESLCQRMHVIRCRGRCTTRGTFPLLLLLHFPKEMCNNLYFTTFHYGLRHGVCCLSCGEDL